MVRLCKEFGQLPYTGGLYAQPYGHILRMEAVLDAIAKVDEAEMKRIEAQQRAEERAKAMTDGT